MITKTCENCDYFDGIGYCICDESEVDIDDSCDGWNCSAFNLEDEDGYHIE